MTRIFFGDLGHEPPVDPPDPFSPPRCPICGEEAETFYILGETEIVGCDCCVEAVDAIDYADANGF